MELCGFKAGLDQHFFLIAGPCVMESEELEIVNAGQLQELTASVQIPFIYKSSFDKANRSSLTCFRGPGMVEGGGVQLRLRRVPRQRPAPHLSGCPLDRPGPPRYIR